MKLLDLFCCQGGASAGYVAAGFDVTGVDIDPQPRYPYLFVQADAIEYVKAHGHEYDAIHASPPCQAFTTAQKLRGREHPDLIKPTRDALVAAGRPWIIENVVGAPLSGVLLCGTMFGIETYRHRVFESSMSLPQPHHPDHTAPITKLGRPVLPGQYMHVVGNFSGVDRGRRVMGMPWASRDGLREAIPPAYAAYIGAALLSAVKR